MRKGRLYAVENGKKKVIGEIVVDSTDGEYVDFTGHVTDPKYQELIRGEVGHLSIDSETMDATYNPPTVSKSKGQTFKGRVQIPKGGE